MRQMTPVASVGDMANSSNHLKPLISCDYQMIFNDYHHGALMAVVSLVFFSG